jgi:hypothetical protein
MVTKTSLQTASAHSASVKKSAAGKGAGMAAAAKTPSPPSKNKPGTSTKVQTKLNLSPLQTTVNKAVGDAAPSGKAFSYADAAASNSPPRGGSGGVGAVKGSVEGMAGAVTKGGEKAPAEPTPSPTMKDTQAQVEDPDNSKHGARDESAPSDKSGKRSAAGSYRKKVLEGRLGTDSAEQESAKANAYSNWSPLAMPKDDEVISITSSMDASSIHSPQGRVLR